MKQVIALSVSLVAALTAAYLTWTDETEEPTDESVPLYAASEGQVKKVSYSSDSLKVVIEERKDERGTYLWVDSTETREVKKKKDPVADPHAGEDHEGEGHEGEGHEGEAPEGEAPAAEPAPADGAAPAEGAPAEPPQEPAGEVKTERTVFVASAQGKELWEALSPLQALRELEVTGDLAAFGLDQPKATVVVEHEGGTTELKLGGETYGSKDRYVSAGGKVYLVDDASLKPLEFAPTRILERNLFPLEEAKLDQVSATTAAGATASWKHVNKDDQAKAFWARAESPDTDDAAGGTWMDKLMRIKAREYVPEPPATLAPAAQLTVSGEGETWAVEFLQDQADATKWYARTDYNRATVSLTEALVKDLVVDLEELASQAP